MYLEGEEGVNKFDVPNEYYYEVIEEIEQMKMDLDDYHDQVYIIIIIIIGVIPWRILGWARGLCWALENHKGIRRDNLG